jgi:hypothetical protein
MFLSHYPKLNRKLLEEGWAPRYEDHRYPQISVGCVEFAGREADAAMEDLGWLDDEH